MKRAEFLRQAGIFERPKLAPRRARAIPQSEARKQENWKLNLQRVRHFKSHPCIHIDRSEPSTRHVCACGIVYGCALHKECTISSRSDLRVRSCLYCKDYIEKIPPKPAVELKIAIGVTTCPVMKTKRVPFVIRGMQTTRTVATDEVAGYRDTLPKTLDSILAAGWPRDDVTIFAEPESRYNSDTVMPDGWKVVWREKRLGPWWNVYDGMKQLCEECPDADAQFWVEDDTILSPGLRDEINRRGGFPDEKCGLIRLFRMSGMGNPNWIAANDLCENKRGDGWQKLKDGKYLWGSNAMLIRAAAVRAVVATDGNYPPGLSCSPDVKLGVLLRKLGWDEWCANPSLAQTEIVDPVSHLRIPSTTGHVLNEKMRADTYTPLAVIERPEPAPITVHIVRPRDGWILQKIGEAFGLPFGDAPDPAADCNVYVNQDLFKQRTKCDVGYFTHREPDRPQRFDAASKQLDWCIGMSEKTLDLLPEHKRSLLLPGPTLAADPRPLRVGVCAREYDRKRLWLVDAMAKLPNVEVRLTGGKVPVYEMPMWYATLDYLVVTSDLEGGPMPVLEALAARVPVIAPDVGFSWDFPVIRYSTPEELCEIVERLANPVEPWAEKRTKLIAICRQAIAAKQHSTSINIGDRYTQLVDIVREHKPKSIVEVGVSAGDRAVLLIRAAMKCRPIVEYDGYDLFESGTPADDSAEFNGKPRVTLEIVRRRLEALKLEYPGLTYRLHQGRTVDTLQATVADLAFIDGGHSVETIRHDLSKLDQSGVVVLDDWYEPDEHKRCPDVTRFGCNAVLNGQPKTILPIAGRVTGGGLVRMVVIKT